VWARRALGDFWGFETAWWWSLSGSVLYYVFRAVYGGPSTLSCEAGDEAIALAEAEAEEEG
jgi:hypothetical protein